MKMLSMVVVGMQDNHWAWTPDQTNKSKRDFKMGLAPLFRWYKRCRVDGRKLLNIQQPRQSKAKQP